MSPVNQSGMSLPFKWTVASPAGRSNLAHVFALFHTTSASTSDACYIHYDAFSNLVYLADNGSGSWLGGLAPTSDYIAENAQCTIFGTGTSSVNPASSGTQLELTLTVSFKSAFFREQERVPVCPGWLRSIYRMAGDGDVDGSRAKPGHL